MTDENPIRTTLDQTSIEPSPSNNEDVQRYWHGLVKRRSFLKRIGIAEAALFAKVVLNREIHAQSSRCSTGKLPKGDAARLRLAAAVELVEADSVQVEDYERRLDLEQEIQAFEEWQHLSSKHFRR